MASAGLGVAGVGAAGLGVAGVGAAGFAVLLATGFPASTIAGLGDVVVEGPFAGSIVDNGAGRPSGSATLASGVESAGIVGEGGGTGSIGVAETDGTFFGSDDDS